MTSAFLVALRFLLGTLLLGSFILPASIAAQQRPSPPPKRIRREWRGIWTYDADYVGPLLMRQNPHSYHVHARANFSYVQESDALGFNELVAGKFAYWFWGKSTMRGVWEECQGNGTVNFERQELRPPFSPNLAPIKVVCKHDWNGAAFDAEAFAPPPHDLKFFTTCTPKPHECSCRIEKINQGDGGSPVPSVARALVWVASSGFDSVMEVKAGKKGEYWNFVPEPGKTISFSVRATQPVRFRVELTEVSRFPGYAMNADIDDSFFRRYRLEHLKGKYNNNSPDLIFDPGRYKTSDWRWVRPDEVETTKEHTSIEVTVTAMDYAAYGKLRAFAIGRGCGGRQQPVRILVGGHQRDSLTIPMDENDNLIADRMEQPKNGITNWDYSGDPSADDDYDPRSDHTGDGLTTFEEYRGFMVYDLDRNGAKRPTRWCVDSLESRLNDLHVGTDPHRKDLFVYSPDPLLATMAMLLTDDEIDDIDVHIMCPRHLEGPAGALTSGDNEKARVVNFTFQRSGPNSFLGKTISQASPQHGIYLNNERPQDGSEGNSLIGPPKNVDVVRISKDHILNYNGPKRGPVWLATTVKHELGHAIGIDHHGEGNILSNVAILGMASCPAGAVSGIVNGKTACEAAGIVVQHGQNSGEWQCPLRYRFWQWYVPANSPLQPIGNVDFEYVVGHNPRKMTLPGYTGRIMPYNNTADWESLFRQGLGSYCTAKTGTGLNGAAYWPYDEAGDATKGECLKQLHINDVR